MSGLGLLALIRQLFVHSMHFLEFFIYNSLPHAISSIILPTRDHFAAHPDTRFEGYYTRVQTPDGSTLVVIFSSVPNASNGTSHYVHFSLTPSNGSNLPTLRVDMYPNVLKYRELGKPLRDGRQAFRVDADDFGTYSVAHNVQTCRLRLPVHSNNPDNPGETDVLDIDVNIRNRTPLNSSRINQTPHEDVVRLGSSLPLHWHIFSTRSDATFVIKRHDGSLVAEGRGWAHIEKNWGRGFPNGWTWMQAFSRVPSKDGEVTQPSTLAIAGGKALLTKSYMIVYRSPRLQWDFSPPWTSIFGSKDWSPFLSETLRSGSSALELHVRMPTKRLVIRAQGSTNLKDWMHLDCPLFDGHGNVTARETFSARITVDAYVRPLLHFFGGGGGWQKVESQTFDNAAFELGGDYRSSAMLRADRELEKVHYL